MNKKGIFEKVANALDAPVVSVSPEGFIELFSNTQAVVEGVKCILNYNECEIKLSLFENAVAFKGEGLFIKSLNGETAIICGKFVSVEFCTL